MRKSCFSLVAILATFLPAIAKADKLTITSNPPGATVEIDGVKVGTTPFVKDYPGGYFHRTKTALGSRLEHPLVARIKLEGFAPKVVQLCDGPTQWRDMHGRERGEYWTFKVSTFDVALIPIPKVFTGEVAVKTARNLSSELVRDQTLEQIVALVKPSVVYLEGSKRTGTGFLVTGTGLIATNAHVAREEESLIAKLAGGFQLEAAVAYIDDEVDIALLKVEGSNFPHLELVGASAVQQGQEVFAVGNPGAAMLFSVTKGIVSAVGKFPAAGPGTWIQTDAQLNPGNSGGPLINMQGQVIGIATSKPSGADISGIGFALSASELIRILGKFYPTENILTDQLAGPKASEAISTAPLLPIEPTAKLNEGEDASLITHGIVEVNRPPNSEIWIDRQKRGYAPATFQLAPGVHFFAVFPTSGAAQMQYLKVVANSRVTLEPPPALSQPMRDIPKLQ